MKSRKILLFGASGMVGSRILDLKPENINFVAPSRKELDLVNSAHFSQYIENHNPDMIVYAAGIVRQDQAEQEQEIATLLNTSAPGLISKIASKNSIPLVYFSTDAVFDGKKSESPYLEEDRKNPVNFYGSTKAKGEDLVLSASNKNLVIRLISVYSGNYGNKIDFARRGLEILLKGMRYDAIEDLYFNPTYVDDAANGFLKSIEKKITGIIHVAAVDQITNYGFLKLIAKEFQLNEGLVRPVKFKNFFKENSAKRGQFTWLDTSKAQKLLGKNTLHTNFENIKKFKKDYFLQ